MNDRPQPIATADTKPYWQAANEGRLSLPKCQDCGQAHFYPRIFCPHCGSRRLDWFEPTGAGKIYTYTVNHRAANPALKERVPYVVAVIELDEGPRILSNIVDTPRDKVCCGARVQVTFERISEQAMLPQFRVVD